MTELRDKISLLQQLWWDVDPGVRVYQCWTIVYRLCHYSSKTATPNVQWVLNHLYPMLVKPDEIEPEEKHIIEYGLKRWKEADSPRIDLSAPKEIEQPGQPHTQTWWGGTWDSKGGVGGS